MNLLLASLLPTLALGSGLVDHAIAGTSLPVYLDSETWTASTTFQGATTPTVIRATVPGDLITDLQMAGMIGDPLYEMNWKNYSLWDANVWTYTQTFTLTPGELAAIASGSGDTLLVFDGVKMSSSMTLNGVPLGKTTNQFLRYTFSLAAANTAGAKVAGTNTLTVSFDSSDQTTEGRFAACSGGWDWYVQWPRPIDATIGCPLLTFHTLHPTPHQQGPI
jgi:beta-mannosidase